MTWDGSFLLYSAARWLGYLAAFVITGVATIRFRVVPGIDGASESRDRLRRIEGLGFAALLLSLVARLYFQSRSLLEPDEPLTTEFVRLVLDGQWGRGWVAQGAVMVVGLLIWTWTSRRPISRLASSLALTAAGAIAVAAPFTGHAAGLAGAPWYAPLLDLVHFGAGATWLGTLAMVIVVMRGTPANHRTLIEAFSPVALSAGVVTMVAGLVLGYQYLGGLTPLFTTTYGQLLLVKLGAVGITAGLGGYNWRRVLPRLRAGVPAPVVQTATAEVIVGIIILACTAVLVALPAPGESAE